MNKTVINEKGFQVGETVKVIAPDDELRYYSLAKPITTGYIGTITSIKTHFVCLDDLVFGWVLNHQIQKEGN